MKLLQLDPEYRGYLIVKRALELDANGNETLVGLTAPESAEYATMFSIVSTNTALGEDVAPERFIALYERHVEALPHDPWVFDLRRPSTW